MNRVVQTYGFHDRVWHWIQAFAVVGLLVTGLALRFPGLVPGLAFTPALYAHLGIGAFLVLNAVLGLFYFVTSGAIRHYVPQPRDFLTLAALQALYYVRGMFRGAPYPFQKTTRARLNPLQQLTYLAILNLLLPLQVVTGLLLWAAAAGSGSFATAPLHLLGAWLFAAFLLLHVYLTTTGETPLANLRAMITGYEELHPAGEASPTDPEQESTA